MSGEIISLSKARKAKTKAESSAKAAANRAVFGRTKVERTGAKAQSDKAAAILDGHKLTPPHKD